jgi:Uma2 family endonuclease
MQHRRNIAPTAAEDSLLSKRYTLEQFWSLPEPEDRSHYDLIGGCLFMVPPPERPHGDIDAYLNKSLVGFLIANNVGGRVHHPREGVYLDERTPTYVEPDMMYVSEELLDRQGRKRTGADIVFEYLSPSTAKYDRMRKAEAYLDLGVRELWLVDPKTATIEVRRAIIDEHQRSWEARVYKRGEDAESTALVGWRVALDELFGSLPAYS